MYIETATSAQPRINLNFQIVYASELELELDLGEISTSLVDSLLFESVRNVAPVIEL